MTAPIHHTSRAGHSAGQRAGEPARGIHPPDGTGKRSVLQQVWRQLPFFVWLVAAVDAALGPVHGARLPHRE